MLQLKPVYTSDFLIIETDMAAGLARTEWLRSITEDELIQGTTALRNFLVNSELQKVLGNAKKLGSLSPKAKEWLSTSFYELLSETDIKQLARVLPDNLFNKLALESVITRAEALSTITYSIKNFSNEDDALVWLDVKG